MKNLLLLIVLISGNTFAQSNYSITKDANIYDLPGGDFITAKLINDKTHLKHYDITGNVLWEDSISFQGITGTVLFRSVSQFTGTNECVITMTNDLTNYSNWSQNDTLIYQFTKLNLSTHQFTGSLIDTIYTLGGGYLNYSDTSIYFFFSDRSINNGSFFNYATYSLNPSMQLSLIAPSDSILGFWGWDNRFYKINDQILYYQKTDEMNFARRFSSSMSQTAQDTLYANTGTTFMSTLYVTKWNDDSLFVFTEGTTNGSSTVKWRFDWNDSYLTPINSTQSLSPVTDYPLTTIRYETSFNKIAVDKQNKKIMVLANESGNFQPEIVQKVFVYDFNFNLECEIPITIGSKSTNQLKELNDLVYLNITNANSTDLALVDCQLLGIDEADLSNSDFVIYPNPTSNLLFIHNVESSAMKIEVYSTEGKLIQKVSGVESKISIDLSAYENGIYLVSIEVNGIKQTKRVIKS
jgi:hypothetical protein